MDFIKTYAEQITDTLNNLLTLDDVIELIEKPRFNDQGDLAFPCFSLAKQLRKAPAQIAQDIANKIKHDLFEKVEANGPYVNCFLNKNMASQNILQTILKEKSSYGSLPIGKGKNITIDFSSPNIAKPFSMGHLRSTVIGNALANIVEKCGFKAIRINHLGDWGTQFGKLIVAYKLWGNEEKVKEQPIKELLSLYVKFHEEAEKKPSLEDEARKWFKQLEEGNSEAQNLWKWFKDESLHEFTKIYALLDIHFDSYSGEAFYNDKMANIIQLLEKNNLLTQSDGAQVVELKEYDLPPCLIMKKDGATLYATRDLTAALYRKETYQFDKALYVVGQEQSLHFKQVFLVLEKLGYEWAKEIVHIPFGFILKDGKKMSTRKGKVVLLEEVIAEAIQMAKKNIEIKNPNLENKEEVAHMVGIGAIIFQDLKNERQNNIEFSLEEMLKFEGTTGPYVQYTHARACSILRKADHKRQAQITTALDDEYSWSIIKLLMDFPSIIEKSFIHYEPSQIAKYLLDLSKEFNKYYSHVKILSNDDGLEGRLSLVEAITIILKEGLRLLGLKAPEEM
ncbi:arginine--tRNA ligase [Lederbergia wuyishanensis]|uniref:Arginine--tRNA ligase n=1 Tax=Lederbergia wuyishanensis TaxID=1347903 RepID=A0ABU0D098_9BACI|nr:arginine--tRNA ligase [Lederbergia wuyishanensis]MCJ8006448.1 arginine--tRNA ligase [Lederbergia wuyishanensis]MDQ0341823.1 arginyl-tRNA synthetase [Lederbergia wuyishanensis]